MITKETLHKMRNLQKADKSLGNLPKPMFVKGKFAPNNWNGGDDIIRDYFYRIECESEWQRHYEINDGYLTVMFYYAYDQSFGVIIHNKIDYDYGDSDFDIKKEYDVYFFTWYKHRGQLIWLH